MGSYTTALFSGNAAATLIGLQLFCLGAQLKLGEFGAAFRLGGMLLVPKLVNGFLCVGLFLLIAPAKTVGGISALCAVAALTNINGSMFLSLSALYDRKAEMACAPLLTLSNGPFFTLLILGMSGLSSFPGKLLLATLLPMLLGMAAACVHRPLSEKLKPCISILLPFIGFALGAGMDLASVWRGGICGVLLALIAMLLTLAAALAAKLICKRSDGIAVLMSGATGANAVAIPAAVAMIDPAWQAYVPAATAQIIACVLLSAIWVPLITAAWQKKEISRVDAQYAGYSKQA